MNDTRTSDRWTVTLKREGKPTLIVRLPTLNEALEVSRTDAAWYGTGASVLINPIISETKGA